MEFPPTKLYLFSSNDGNVLKRLMSTVSSSKYRPVEDWEIVVLLKLPKMNKKLLEGARSEGQRIPVEGGFYFIRFHDSNCMVCTPREGFQDKNSARICELGIEEKLSKVQELSTRTSWRVLGKQFKVGQFIIGIGSLDHRGNTFTAIEITALQNIPSSSLETQDDSDTSSGGSSGGGGGGWGFGKPQVQESYIVMDDIVNELLLEEEKVHLAKFDCWKGDESITNRAKGAAPFDLIDRSIQWISAIASTPIVSSSNR